MKRFLMLSFLACVCWLPVRSQSISVLGTPSFEINTSDTVDYLIVPLKLDGITYKELVTKGTRPLYVSFNSRNSMVYQSAITFAKDLRQECLNVRIQTDKLNAAGKYEVNVSFTGKDTTKTFPLVFFVTRPPGTLESLGVVQVKVSGDKVSKGAFAVREITQRSAITDIQPESLYLDGPIGVNLLSFAKENYQVGPGKRLLIDYAVDPKAVEELPFGLSRGSMQLTSSQLSAPLKVSFEIVRARNKWWLLATVCAGLICGALVRHLLKDNKDLQEANLAAQKLLLDMKEWQQTIGDQGNIKAVEDLTKRLSETLLQKIPWIQKGASEKLAKTTAEVLTAYNKVKSDLQTHINGQKDVFFKLSLNLQNLNLPFTIAGRLQEVESILDRAQKQLDDFDPTRGEMSIGEASVQLMELVNDFISYVASVLDLMTTAEFLPNEAGEITKSTLLAHVESVKAKLEEFKGFLIGGSPIADVLVRTIVIQNRLEDLFVFLQESVLHDLKLKKPFIEQDAKFMNAFGEWINQLEQVIQNTGLKVDAKNHWDPVRSENVDKAFVSADGTSPGFNTEKLKVTMAERFARKGMVSASFAAFKNQAISKTILLKQIRSSERLWLLYEVLQTVILTFLIVLSVYNANGQNFTGTCSQLITIFFISFSVDISVENLLKLSASKS